MSPADGEAALISAMRWTAGGGCPPLRARENAKGVCERSGRAGASTFTRSRVRATIVSRKSVMACHPEPRCRRGIPFASETGFLALLGMTSLGQLPRNRDQTFELRQSLSRLDRLARNGDAVANCRRESGDVNRGCRVGDDDVRARATLAGKDGSADAGILFRIAAGDLFDRMRIDADRFRSQLVLADRAAAHLADARRR